MEDLQGGTLALEHRYDVESHEGVVAQMTQYRATQHPFARPVLVSVFDVFDSVDAPDDLNARIKEAAQTWSTVRVEGVLRCADFGELSPKVPFVVSERVKAPTLAQWLESAGTMSPEDVVRLVDRLAGILDSLHAEKIVHGGLGSHWIYLADENPDRAVVSHLGIGLTMTELRSLENAMLSFQSLAALPPEAFDEGATPTVAWDVYALGAIAYQALAGVHPFFDDENDTSEGLLRIRSEEARALEEFGLSSDVSEVVARAVGPVDARWSSAGAFSAALRDAVLPAEPAETERASPKPVEVQVEPDTYESDESIDELVRPDLEPTPGGTFVGLLVLVLLLSNLAWFYASAAAVDDVPSDDTTVTREVLKTDIRIASEPSDARVLQIGGVTAEELGRTPLMVSSTLAKDGVLKLRLEDDAGNTSRVDLRKSDAGQDVVVYLKNADPPQ